MKHLYKITEIGKGHFEVYSLVMTAKEIASWLKMKREVYGYIPGVGGDRTFDCFAVKMD